MICIGFGTNDRLHSKTIRWATKSQWSHCWIEFPSSVWGGRWVAHSGPDGVVKIPIEKLHRKYPERCLYELSIDVERLHSGFEWARQRIGVDYDYGVIWNVILLLLWRATGWKFLWDIALRNTAKDSCSDFVAGFLIAASVTGSEKLDPDLSPPEEVRLICDSSEECTWLGHG